MLHVIKSAVRSVTVLLKIFLSIIFSFLHTIYILKKSETNGSPYPQGAHRRDIHMKLISEQSSKC